MRLRQTAYTARGAILRKHALWVLLLSDGVPLARIARLAGVSRPTVYRYVKIFLLTRNPGDLRSSGSGRLLERERG
jgi:transposase-like protein